MFTLSRSAALTALYCLLALLSCGDPLEPHAEERFAEDGLAPEVDPNLGPPAKDGVPTEAAAVELDETSGVLSVGMSAFPLSVEAFAVDGAVFDDNALIVAARTATGPLVIHHSLETAEEAHRKASDQPVSDKPADGRVDSPKMVERSRLALERQETSAIAVLHGPALSPLALWTADGHLEALALTTSLATSKPRRIAAEEGGAYKGAPVVAVDGGSVVVCLSDADTPLCLSLDRDLNVNGIHSLSKYRRFEPVALTHDRNGFFVILSRCLGETCGREDLLAQRLDREGTPRGKARGLPQIQTGRGRIIIPRDDGLLLVARRSGAGEHAAWTLTDSGLAELDGRFSRVVGGFSSEGRELFVERAFLRMRDGFPVTGFVSRPIEVSRSKKSASKVVREAFPEAVDRALPNDVDQEFSAFGDTLMFEGPRRQGKIPVTVVKLGASAPR